ncbi:hypothetical protein LUU34_00779100 [Aix galericulata]|nr:hypothetical protein LUU34_00779100 [Aix galericulata]
MGKAVAVRGDLRAPLLVLLTELRVPGHRSHRHEPGAAQRPHWHLAPPAPAWVRSGAASPGHPEPAAVVKMSGSEPERPQFLFVKALASRGRLEAVTQQMGYHPRYLDSFLKTQHYLLHMDGPLPFDCRHYIAIMPKRAGPGARWTHGVPAGCSPPGADAAFLQAAARHQCRYLVNLHVLQFLRAGGDPQWLRGLDFIPPKLRNLNEINKILAHRPWLITKEHIEKLLKISEWSWSLAELVHAVVLLAHCHALASFVFGCGCEQEEGPGGRGSLKASPPGNQCFCEAATGNGCSQELLRINRKRSLDSCMELDSLRERIQRIHVETEGREETRLLPPDREEDTVGEVTGAANLACYMQDPDFGYQDFARRDEDQTQVFRVQVRLLALPAGGEWWLWGACVAPSGAAPASLRPWEALPREGTHPTRAGGGEATAFCPQEPPQVPSGPAVGEHGGGGLKFVPKLLFPAVAKASRCAPQDYSWEDHGFSLVNRLYSDIGHLLDEKFRMVDGLQSSAMAKRQGCEPSVFKRGIWNYIHCMFGIRYDDYDYAEVNHLLERMLKVYIKTVTCYPEKTNPEMFDRFWKQFKHSEKVGARGWDARGSTGETFEPPNHTEGGENGNLLFVGSCTQQGVGSVATSSTGSSEAVTPIREHLGASPRPSRKPGQRPVHVNLLILEARMQAELLYALQAITQYMVS